MNQFKVSLQQTIFLSCVGVYFLASCTPTSPPAVEPQPTATTTPPAEKPTLPGFINQVDTSGLTAYEYPFTNRDLPGHLVPQLTFLPDPAGVDKRNCPSPQFIAPAEVEVWQPIELFSCGWNKSGPATLTMITPAGQSFSQTVVITADEISELYTASASHRPGWGAEGKYQFVFEYDGQRFEQEVQVVAPAEPRFVFFQTDQTDNLVLYQFDPAEEVEVVAYEQLPNLPGQGHFVARESYTTNPAGQLWLTLPHNPLMRYAVLGQKSGEAHPAGGGRWLSTPLTAEASLTPTFTCPSAPPTRLQVGDQVQVTFTDGSPNRIRQSPASSTILGSAPEGTKMVILEGPECKNERVWWKVTTENGYTGWTAEGNMDAYWLELTAE